MFFSDNIPLLSSSLSIFFLFRDFWRDFLRFAISNVETLLPSEGFSLLSNDNSPLPSGSLLKLPLSEP